jgi:hypothetical protein
MGLSSRRRRRSVDHGARVQPTLRTGSELDDDQRSAGGGAHCGCARNAATPARLDVALEMHGHRQLGRRSRRCSSRAGRARVRYRRGAGSAARASRRWDAGHVFRMECGDQVRDLLRMGREREVAGVEEMKFCVWYVGQVGAGGQRRQAAEPTRGRAPVARPPGSSRQSTGSPRPAGAWRSNATALPES